MQNLATAEMPYALPSIADVVGVGASASLVSRDSGSAGFHVGASRDIEGGDGFAIATYESH